MELRKELVDQFEIAKGRVLRKLGNTPTSYKCATVLLYPETGSRAGLYLGGDGQFFDQELMMGDNYPASAGNFVMLYARDHKGANVVWARYMDEWYDRLNRTGYSPTMEDPKNKEIIESNPPPTLQGIIEQHYSQEEIDTILQEGIRLMEEAFTKEPNA